MRQLRWPRRQRKEKGYARLTVKGARRSASLRSVTVSACPALSPAAAATALPQLPHTRSRVPGPSRHHTHHRSPPVASTAVLSTSAASPRLQSASVTPRPRVVHLSLLRTAGTAGVREQRSLLRLRSYLGRLPCDPLPVQNRPPPQPTTTQAHESVSRRGGHWCKRM